MENKIMDYIDNLLSQSGKSNGECQKILQDLIGDISIRIDACEEGVYIAENNVWL